MYALESKFKVTLTPPCFEQIPIGFESGVRDFLVRNLDFTYYRPYICINATLAQSIPLPAVVKLYSVL